MLFWLLACCAALDGVWSGGVAWLCRGFVSQSVLCRVMCGVGCCLVVPGVGCAMPCFVLFLAVGCAVQYCAVLCGVVLPLCCVVRCGVLRCVGSCRGGGIWLRLAVVCGAVYVVRSGLGL